MRLHRGSEHWAPRAGVESHPLVVQRFSKGSSMWRPGSPGETKVPLLTGFVNQRARVSLLVKWINSLTRGDEVTGGDVGAERWHHVQPPVYPQLSFPSSLFSHSLVHSFPHSLAHSLMTHRELRHRAGTSLTPGHRAVTKTEKSCPWVTPPPGGPRWCRAVPLCQVLAGV